MGIARVMALLACAACANANSGSPDATAFDSTPADVSAPTNHCSPGEFATNIVQGQVVCASIQAPTLSTLDERCSVYMGWQDGCDGCITPPVKWGFVGGDRCTNGAGADNACTLPTLGGKQVRLFGLNPDGDVDGNDKLHAGLHCTAAAPSGAIAPCPAGEFVTGTNGVSVRCEPLALDVIDYVKTQCEIYTGWQDSCDGCVTAPAKWGHSGDAACMNGVGGDSTCNDVALGTEMVKLFGLNPDGDVDGNDKLHAGISCGTAAATTTTTMAACPAGQLVVGVASDGMLECASPAPTIADTIAGHCTLYFGWSDNCEGCNSPPAKWGTAKPGQCANGTGGDNTCTTFMLGGVPVAMFGLNPDGDVDGNDTLFVGFTCR
ncbi:MAG TPA: hypothetical protein VL326_19025 [Kofleriaceae bacterium]|nr:hypothetical protein [Kofleriaceae bacterium]